MPNPRPLYRRLKVHLLALAVLTLAHAAGAQERNAERGLNAHSYLGSEFDQVNLYNGNLTLTVPIGQNFKVGGQLQYSLSLVYNSFVWDYKREIQPGYGHDAVQANPNPYSNAGLGWMLSLGALYPPNTPPFNEDTQRYLYVAPDGSKYKFGPQLSDGDPLDITAWYSQGSPEPMRLTLHQRKIEFADGVAHYFDADYLLSRMEDRHGNKLVVTRSPTRWTLTEECASCAGTAVRQHTIDFADGRVWKVRLSAFERPPAGGALPEYDYVFSYDVKNIPRDHKDTWVRPDNTINVALLSSVQLPARAGFYNFTYYDVYRENSGYIKTATLPTRGTYRWSYGAYDRPINRPRPECPTGCADYQEPTSRTYGVYLKEIMKLPGGSVVGTVRYGVNYGPPLIDTDPLTTAFNVVRSADGDDTVNYFNVAPDERTGHNRWDHGLPFDTRKTQTLPDGSKVYLSQEFFKGPAVTAAGLPGEKLRSVYVRYDAMSSSHGVPINPHMVARRVVYNDTGSDADTYFKDWNGLGKFRTVETGGTFKRGNSRTVTIDYGDRRPAPAEPWVLNTFTQEVTSERGRSATRQYCFDPGTNFLKRKRLVKGESPGVADVLIEYVPDDDGNVAHEKYFGGDEARNAPAGELCSAGLTSSETPEYQLDHTYKYGTLATSRYAGADFYTAWNDIDQKTGLVKESRDVSDLRTTFEYDEIGRLVKVMPGGPGAGEGFDAATEYVYTAAAGDNGAAVEVRKTGAAGLLTSTVIRYDSFGRPTLRDEGLPNGVRTSQETKYTVSGLTSTVSTFGNTTNVTTYSGYDPFDRARRVTRPDASVAEFVHKGVERVEKRASLGTGPVDAAGDVGQAVATSVETYDRQGRLTEVEEPSGPGGNMITTRYDYDVGGRLTEVAIRHDPTKSAASELKTNVARSGTATSSPSINGSFPAAAAINGDRRGAGWGSGGGWNDATENEYSQDWVRVDFSGRRAIWRIKLYTLRTDFAGNWAEPGEAETFSTAPDSAYGITDFEVQYWRDVAGLPPMWRTIPGGKVTGNNKVVREFVLPGSGISTTKLRVVVHRGAEWTTQRNNYSRIVELEAFEGSTNVAAAGRGAQAVASSCVNATQGPCTSHPTFSPSAVIDGDRTGARWGEGGHAGGWNDGTENEYASDWLQVQFDGTKTVDEINVFTLQDDAANPAEPTFNMIFNSNNDRGYGITDFGVQYWETQGGWGRWLTVPEGRVTGNSNVWRNFRFPAVTTDRVRVVVHGAVVWTAAPSNYSRIVEVEAFEPRDEDIDFVGMPARDETTGWQVRRFHYDNRGFLYAERQPEQDFIQGTEHTAEYKYDSMGRVTQKRDARHTLRYEYDASGRITKIADTMGTTEAGASGDPHADDRPLKTFGYFHHNGENEHRLGKMRYASRHNWIKNPYDEFYPNVAEIDVQVTEEYRYTGRGGRLGQRDTKYNSASATAYHFEQKFYYDELGGLVGQDYPRCLNATCRGLDTSGSPVAPDSSVPRPVTYANDSGYLEGVGVPGSPTRYAELGYHNNKMLSLVKHKYGGGVEASDSYTIDATTNMARPRSVTFTANGMNYNSGVYKYDGAGNILRIGVDRYVYDKVGRLVEATAGEAPAAGKRSQKYTYDPLGNMELIETFDGAGGGVATMDLTVDTKTNRLGGLVRYDGSGNVTGYDIAGHFVYDQFNMQKYAPGTTFLYGPSDERMWIVDHAGRSNNGCVSSIVELVTLRGLEGEVVREYRLKGPDVAPSWCQPSNPLHRKDGDKAGNWAWMKDYVYAGGRLLASESPIGRRDYHLDHLGSPRRITRVNAAQTGVTVAESRQYLPFGEEAAAAVNEPEAARLKFTGHEHDASYGPWQFEYMHSRFYTAPHARFISVDPDRDFEVTKPQSWNLYSYVRNNPMRYVDKTGGYGEDFHYTLTHMLARAAGYSDDMARSVAGETQGVDDGDRSPWRSVESRRNYHFTTPQRRLELFGAAYEAAMGNSETSGYAIGEYLHALQDSFSHKGYGERIGHFWTKSPDQTHKNPQKALTAAHATYEALRTLNRANGVVVPWKAIEPYVLAYLEAPKGSKARQAAQKRLLSFVEQYIRDAENDWWLRRY